MNTDENSELQKYLQLSIAALHNENRVAARRWAQKAVQHAPDTEAAWLILASLAEPRASIQYLEKALEINPASRRARSGLVWAKKRLRETQELTSESPSPQPTPRVEHIQPVQTFTSSAPIEDTHPIRVKKASVPAEKKSATGLLAHFILFNFASDTVPRCFSLDWLFQWLGDVSGRSFSTPSCQCVVQTNPDPDAHRDLHGNTYQYPNSHPNAYPDRDLYTHSNPDPQTD